MAGQKRAFPYYSEIDDFEIKRPAFGVNPSRDVAEPRAFDGGITFQVRCLRRTHHVVYTNGT